MKKLLTIALVFTGLTVNAQSVQPKKVTVSCTVKGKYVTFTKAQKDSVNMYVKKGYKNAELIANKVALYKF